MTERRYGDDEVREIFSLATTGDGRDRSLRAESGELTLAEIQRIGQEAGIEPARVAEAALRVWRNCLRFIADYVTRTALASRCLG